MPKKIPFKLTGFFFVLLSIFNNIEIKAQCNGAVSYSVNPLPTAGTYPAGTVVNICFTMNGFNQAIGTDFFEGFDINLGPGWQAGSITPVTPPGNCSGVGQWVWTNSTTAAAPPFNTFGPGYFYDYNMDGNPGNDWGDDNINNCVWTFCFNVTVGSVVGSSLSVNIAPLSDGIAGSWISNTCLGVNYTNVISPAVVVAGCNGLSGAISGLTHNLCNGQSNGSFTITANGSIGPYNYALNGGPLGATNTFNNLAAGPYVVTIQDGNLCTITANVTINQPSVLNLGTNFQNNVGCNGGASGSVNLSATGGVAPYQYSIDGINFVPGNIFNGLVAGAYTFTVKDANGCTDVLNITINQPNVLTLTISAQTNAGCGVNNGSVTVLPNGGTPAYIYSFNGGAYGLPSTFNNLAPGNYTVTVKDANNCTAIVNVSITSPPAINLSVASQTNVVCFGGNNGSITLSAAGGTLPYTFNIGGPGQASATFNSLSSGNYTATVTDAAGCSAQLPFTISQPAATVSLNLVNQQNINCFGAATGSFEVSASGGTVPYSYAVAANSNLTGIFNTLNAGNYVAIVTDANGCTNSLNITLTQPATGLSGFITVQNNVLCSGTSTGSFTVVGQNGAAPYAYNLNGNVNGTGTYSGLAAGIYNVIITDNNLCTATQQVNLISPNALSGSTVSVTPVNCFNGTDGELTVSAVNGTASYQFTLGAQSNTTGIFTGLSAGNYGVTITDQNGCTFIQNVNVQQPAAALNASLTNVNHVGCFGNSTGLIQVNSSGGTPAYTYQLGALVNGTGLFNNLSAGNYNIQVTDNNNCTASIIVAVNQPAAALASQVQSTTAVSCFGGNNGQVQINGLNGTAPYTYTLAPTVNSTGTFTGLSNGNYNVTVTDNNGCTTVQPFTILQPATSVSAAVAAQQNVLCAGTASGSVTLSAAGGTPGYSYMLTGSPSQVSPQFNNLLTGTYNFTIQDNNGCTDTVNVNITQPSGGVTLSLLTTNDVSCYGDATGLISVSANGGSPGYTFTIPGSSNTTGNFVNLTAGNYLVEVTDANNCSSTLNVTLIQPAVPLSTSITSFTDVICNGQSNGTATANATGGTAVSGYQFLWNNSAATSGSLVTGLAPGNYTVTVTDDNGCTATAAVAITEPNFILNAPASFAVCNGADSILNVSSLDGFPPVNYIWNDLNSGIQYNGATVSLQPLQTTNYTVVGVDANGCQTAVANFTITVNPLPVSTIAYNLDNGCKPLCVSFEAQASMAGVSFAWDFGNGQSSSSSSDVICYTQEGTYPVTLTGISPLGCTSSQTYPDLIAVHPVPVAYFECSTTNATMADARITFTNTSIGADKFEWNFGDNTASDNSMDAYHEYKDPGTYCVMLTSRNEYNCEDTTQHCITLGPAYSFYVPTSFTPNNDGLNDFFRLRGENIAFLQLSVFNRWGIKVFETAGNQLVEWSGDNLPQDTYTYIVTTKSEEGMQKSYTGTVTLLR